MSTKKRVDDDTAAQEIGIQARNRPGATTADLYRLCHVAGFPVSLRQVRTMQAVLRQQAENDGPTKTNRGGTT